MPKSLKTIDISPDLYEKVKKRASELGISIRALTEDALREVVEGGKASDKSEDFKKIILRFDTRCKECGVELKRGQIGYWLKGYGVICPECYLRKQIEGLGDKSLAKRYLRVFELRKIERGLKKRVDELAETVLEAEKTTQMMRDIAKLRDDLRMLATRMHMYIGDYSKLDELLTLLKDISDRLDAIATFMPRKLREVREKLAEVRERL